MAETLLMTGFPGFIGARLVERLLQDEPPSFFFLVEARFLFAAKERLEQLERELPALVGRWSLVVGDITAPRLGLDDRAFGAVRAEVTQVWHLAALYDLAAALAPSYRINVEGTANVLALCGDLPHLRKLVYVSTCYVAGDRTGVIYEDELDRGQGFKNHYESTKHWAERLVWARSVDLPTVIVRPSIVVGDSRTGAIAKGDGPYFVLGLLLRLPRLLPFVQLGSTPAPVNLVPVDYVIDAMALLAAHPDAVGRTFHLADPNPYDAAALTRLFVKELGRAPVLATVPDALAVPLTRSRRVSRLLGIPREAFPYFAHPASFDVSNTAELLADLRAPCPDFASYLPQLIAYVRANPGVLHGRAA